MSGRLGAGASRPRRWRFRIASALAALAVSICQAPDALARSQWEAGIGVAAAYLPDYRGSDEGSLYLLPFPYITYTSERLHIDRSGIVARLFDSERVELDASFTGGIALRSSGNRARNGMPTLHPTGEAGPEMVVRLIGERDTREPRLDLRVAVRAAFAFGDGRVEYVGWTASPYLKLALPNAMGSDADVNFTLGLLYGDDRYHDYLYSVDPQFAAPARPAYDAPGGFAGVQSQLSFGRRFGDFWFGGFLRVDSLRGASAVEDSPLVRARSYVAGGVGVAWIFAGSR